QPPGPVFCGVTHWPPATDDRPVRSRLRLCHTNLGMWGPRGTASEIFGYHYLTWNMHTQEKVIGDTSAGPFAKGGNMCSRPYLAGLFIVSQTCLLIPSF